MINYQGFILLGEGGDRGEASTPNSLASPLPKEETDFISNTITRDFLITNVSILVA